jgi:hypothetical protein
VIVSKFNAIPTVSIKSKKTAIIEADASGFDKKLTGHEVREA